MSERGFIATSMGVCVSAWVYYLATYLGGSVYVRCAAPLVGLLAATAMWVRYRGGYRTEVAFAEEIPRGERIFITVAMAVTGLGGAFVAPRALGFSDVPWMLTVPIALSCASTLGWIAWRHPTLFYRGRRF